MNFPLLHRHRRSAPLCDQLDHCDYDAQSDLALRSSTHPMNPRDITAPFAGSLVPHARQAGYDLERDIGA
jgi:hypothetical protein